MKPFEFLVPASLEDALVALRDDGEDVRPIAGGQSLLLEMKERRRTPSRLISVTALPGLSGWSHAESGELLVGAGTTYAALSAAELPGWHALLASVAGDLADRPVRTMGTIGGALCQADPRFDMPTLAVGLDAQLVLASVQEERIVPAGSDLRRGEILTAIRFPGLEHYTAAAFDKVRHRVFDAAVASAVCALRADGEIRLTLGAVAPTPIVVDVANLDDARDAATAALEAVVTADTRERRYQREVVGVVARRAVSRAFDQKRS